MNTLMQHSKLILLNISQFFLFFIFLLSFTPEVNATVSMTYPFASSMVLQRNQTVPIWGTAASGEVVTVTFNGQTKSVTTSSTTKWRVVLDPMIEKGPLVMTVKGNNTLTFTDVYIGEVWNCAGQSNMDTRLSYYTGLADTILAANNPLLRYIDVRYTLMGSNIGWHAITPSTAGGCSATAYFFGKQLQKKLGCAVGLLVTAVGGTYIESWFDPVTLAENPKMVLPSGFTTPGDMYSSYIAPVLTYGIKGTVCMHGEQNAGDSITAPLYGERFKKLITGWRRAWGQGDFPFYYGQITMYNTKAAPDTLSPIVQVREGQRSALVLPNTGMSVNLDLSAGGWHFPNKSEAGRRLALLALAKDYGQSTLEYSGPVYEKIGVQGAKVKIQFSHTGLGLTTTDTNSPTGYLIAGADNVWYSTTTTAIVDSTIVISSTNVTTPVKIAYVLGKTSCNLSNKNGLPASPFRSDRQYWSNGINQIISMAELNRVSYILPDFSPATTTSGLKITYESDNPNIANITADGMVHITGAGTCKIKAYQKGDSIYRSSAVLTQTLVVNKASQTIAFPDIPAKIYGDAPVELAATASSGLPVTYSVTAGDAVSLSGNVAKIVKAGTVTIKASQAGNVGYFGAAAVTKNLTISKANLTITATDTLRNLSAENPLFKLKYDGFVYADNADSIDVKPILSCTADKTSPVGDYIISASGASDNNYNISYVDGKLTVIDNTGLDNIQSRFSVYPLPVQQQLNIDLDQPANSLIVTLEALNGQKVLEKSQQSGTKLSLDCSNLTSGIYILKVCKDNQVFVRRIVKQ